MELLSLVAGAILAAPVVWWLALRRHTALAAPVVEDVAGDGGTAADRSPDARPRATRGARPQAPVVLHLQGIDCIEELAENIGDELGDFTTAVEGHAQLLCEALGDPIRLPARAETLWQAVRRLRLFSEKILCFSGRVEFEPAPVSVGKLLIGLRQEMEDYSAANVRVDLRVAPTLPLAAADPQGLRYALLFTIDTLLDLEPGASVLAIEAGTEFADDDTLVEIELSVDPGDATAALPAPGSTRERELVLDFGAARNLCDVMGATLHLMQQPAIGSSARITLPCHDPGPDTDGPPVLADAGGAPHHRFGGVLLLEEEANLRALIAAEVEQWQRNVLPCKDGADARSLLAATPERFELIVLDTHGRGEGGLGLAAHVLEHHPATKLLLIGRGRSRLAGAEQAPTTRLREIPKPFGLNDLREALQVLLGLPPESVASAADPAGGGVGVGTDPGSHRPPDPRSAEHRP